MFPSNVYALARRENATWSTSGLARLGRNSGPLLVCQRNLSSRRNSYSYSRRNILNRKGSFPGKVNYAQVAPRVGLDYRLGFRDVETFEVHRSRIPTDLFKSIMEDMDVMYMQYGPPFDHETNETNATFYSPIFNNLVEQFAFIFRNDPVNITRRRIGTGVRLEYFFKNFGIITLLFVKMRSGLLNNATRLKAIARVIVECNECDLKNRSSGCSLPIHCIYSDGWSFEFLKFERTPNPTFLRGCFPGDPEHLQRGLRAIDVYRMSEDRLPFILQMRWICEAVFDMMLNAYITGLRVKSKREEKRLGPVFDEAIQSAEQALAAFREAEIQREEGDIVSADATASRGLLALQQSTGAVPTAYKTVLFMEDWDEDEVRRA